MPVARRKTDRLHQISRWLAHRFPLPYPWKLSLARQIPVGYGDLGDCDLRPVRGKRRIFLWVNGAQHLREAITTLLHEWAHARTVRPGKLERLRSEQEEYHDDVFYIELGKIEREFFYYGGARESGRF